MGTFSHIDPSKRVTTTVTKPPGLPVRICTGQMWIEGYRGGSRWVTCTHGAVWAIQEVSYCHHHLPTRYIEVAQARKVMWADLGAELWRDICAEVPVPEEVE